MRKPYVGIWVDHTQAHLIWIDEQGEAEVRYTQVESSRGGEKGDRALSGRTGVYGGVAPHAAAEDKRREKSKRLYEKIIKAMSGARRIYIFGPGQARKELHKRLRQPKDITGEVAGVAGAEKMSEAQMIARVKAFFDLPRSVL